MISCIRDHRDLDLDLVELHCYSSEKIGRDAGEIVGIDPVDFDHQPTDRPKPQVVPIPMFTTPRRGRCEHGNDRLSGRDHRNPHIEYVPAITRRFPVAHVLCAPPRAPTCDSQPPTTRTFRWYSACA
jgi:hypothetical protein